MTAEAAPKLTDYRRVKGERPETLPEGRLLVPLDWLVPNAENPRVIHAERFANLTDTIRQYPFFLLERQILVADGPTHRLGGLVYGGNQRRGALEALYADGWDSGLWPQGYAPISVRDLDRETATALLFIDNNQWGDFDERQAAELLHRLQAVGTNITLLGFEDTNALLAKLQEDSPPESFRELDESTVTVNTTCPRCGYAWQHTSSTKKVEDGE